jgi:hypothetical protein
MQFKMKRLGLAIVLFLSLVLISSADKSGKYSKKANEKPPPEKYEPDLR